MDFTGIWWKAVGYSAALLRDSVAYSENEVFEYT